MQAVKGNVIVLPACVPLFSVMLFGVRAVRKAVLLRLMVEFEVILVSREASSVSQSAGCIAAALMDNFSFVLGNVQIVLFSFSVNMSNGEPIRYC